ncbi:odorant receptor 33a-like [Phlebotomus papatasi]|uniref:odorant receptor 33a-like n=1 Tax=Phlebotomus papatasi TaxID=29031 RepID=UPI0024837144|nr:odorant receptor 33a-like [Phlebotomus papatasi]
MDLKTYLLSMSFSKLFKIFKFSVVSKTFRPLHGDYKSSVFFILLTIYSIIICGFAGLRCIYTFTDTNVKLMETVFAALIVQGFGQTIVKNLCGLPFQREFEYLVDWIEELNAKVEDNELIRGILEEELARSKKYSLIFLECVSLMFFICGILTTYNWLSNDYICIIIPNLPRDTYPVIYNIVQLTGLYIAAFSIIISDLAIVFIGFYLMGFMMFTNKLIQSHTDIENLQKCPDLLMHIMQNHLEIIRILGIFNEAVKLTSFLQLLFSTFTFLTLIFGIQMFKGELIMYFGFATLMIQLALLCLFGQMIRSQTEEIFINLYLTNWYELSLKEQKTIQMMMINSCEPIGLKAAGMYDITLMSLIQILKLSVSYSAIIIAFTRD